MRIHHISLIAAVFMLVARTGNAGQCGAGARPEGEFTINPAITDGATGGEGEAGGDDDTPIYYLFPGQSAVLTGTPTDSDCHCGSPKSDSFVSPSGHKWQATGATLSATSGPSVTITAPGTEAGSADDTPVVYAVDDKGDPHNDGGFIDADKAELRFPKPILTEVTFKGCIGNIVPDEGGNAYGTPHCVDNNNNQSFEDLNDHNFPVCYKVSSPVTVVPKWTFGKHKAPSGSKFYVTLVGPGIGPAQLKMTDIPADYDYTKGEITLKDAVAVAGATGDRASFFDGEAFTWTLTVDTPAGKHSWAAGVNTNRLYTILTDPGQTTLFESVVDISCRGAYGTKVEADIFAGIWALFENPSDALTIKRKAKDGKNKPDDTLLSYHLPKKNVQKYTVAELLKDGHGACQAWAYLLRDLLKIQGVTIQLKVITSAARSTTVSGSPISMAPGIGILLLKTFTVATVPPTLVRVSWSPGQGNPEPGVANAFPNHAIIRYKSKIYDPSYGGPAHAEPWGDDETGQEPNTALGRWEAHSLSGIAYQTAPNELLPFPDQKGFDETREDDMQ